MAKRFSLQRVLEYKERVQDVREGELARVVAEEHEQRQQLRRLEERRATTLNHLLEAQVQPSLDLDEITTTQAFVEGLQAQVRAQSDVVASLGVQVAEARESLLAARRETKTLEKLKENEAVRWLLGEKLLESRQLDEMSTVRFARAQRGKGERSSSDTPKGTVKQ